MTRRGTVAVDLDRWGELGGEFPMLLDDYAIKDDFVFGKRLVFYECDEKTFAILSRRLGCEDGVGFYDGFAIAYFES